LKKNSIVCLILVGLLLSTFLLIRPVDAEEPQYQSISVHDAEQIIENTPNVVILDVRNQSEYDLGHLYDAQLIPLNSLENRTIPIEIEQPSTNDTFTLNMYQQILNSFNLSAHVNDPVIVYCKAGSRSAQHIGYAITIIPKLG
jgi:rhodanese-related sulfurtransferase